MIVFIMVIWYKKNLINIKNNKKVSIFVSHSHLPGCTNLCLYRYSTGDAIMLLLFENNIPRFNISLQRLIKPSPPPQNIVLFSTKLSIGHVCQKKAPKAINRNRPQSISKLHSNKIKSAVKWMYGSQLGFYLGTAGT